MCKNNLLSFGEQLKVLRVRSNLSLRELSSRISVDYSLLCKIERNERPPTIEQVRSIASYFGTSEKRLLIGHFSDMFANKILKENIDIATLRVAERKLKQLYNYNSIDK